jgi:hypothetical protein
MSILGRFSSGTGLRLDLLVALEDISDVVVFYAMVRSFYAFHPSKKIPLCISTVVSG